MIKLKTYWSDSNTVRRSSTYLRLCLNKDFRYQLTAIGSPGPNLHIAKEIFESSTDYVDTTNNNNNNNDNHSSFKVADGTSGMKVSWQVTFDREYRSFEEARSIVHSLRIKNQSEWWKFCKSEKKPTDIPSNPAVVYEGDWKSWGDWFGTYFIANRYRKYLDLETGREKAPSLG